MKINNEKECIEALEALVQYAREQAASATDPVNEQNWQAEVGALNDALFAVLGNEHKA